MVTIFEQKVFLMYCAVVMLFIPTISHALVTGKKVGLTQRISHAHVCTLNANDSLN